MNVQRRGPQLTAVQYMTGPQAKTMNNPNHNGWIVRDLYTKRILFFTFNGPEALDYHSATASDYEVREAWGNVSGAKQGDWLVSARDGILHVVSNERFEADFVRV